MFCNTCTDTIPVGSVLNEELVHFVVPRRKEEGKESNIFRRFAGNCAADAIALTKEG